MWLFSRIRSFDAITFKLKPIVAIRTNIANVDINTYAPLCCFKYRRVLIHGFNMSKLQLKLQ